MKGPDTKYRMLWCGKWRPVLHMYDANNIETTLAMRASKAVLWCKEPPDSGFIATIVSPGDIVERFDRDPSAREWDEMID